MKKRTMYSISGLLIFMFAGVSLAGAFEHGKGGHGGQGMRGKGYGQMGNYSSLTPEQQAVVQKSWDDFRKNTQTLRDQMFAKYSEMNALIYGGKADDKQIEALSKEIGELHGKLVGERSKVELQLKNQGVSFGGRGRGMHGMMGGMHEGGMMNGMGAGMCDNGPALQK